MKRSIVTASKFTALIAAFSITASNAFAQPPEHAKSNNAKPRTKEPVTEVKVERQSTTYRFTDSQRIEIRNYYSEELKKGHCPPGLSKKNNGCQPPGQARKWVVGQPLPRDLIYYNVPGQITIQLGVPPAGHRFIRVANDILLIAIGTGMVIDAIEDLGKL